MQQVFSDQEMKVIDDLLDTSKVVSFWLDVTDDDEFIFRKFNSYYSEFIGMDMSDLLGKTPKDALPPRLAETILRNYEVCRASAEMHVYEELLEIGEGERWWKTTLSPIVDEAGRVRSILGQAVDISELKLNEFSGARAQAQIFALNDELRSFTSMAVQDMRGPFMTIMGVVNFLRDGFVDLGDGKTELVEYCQTLAREAMQQMDSILERSQAFVPDVEPLLPIDLGSLSGDLVALVDPGKRFEIQFPNLTVRTDRVALQLILRLLIENAMHHCVRLIDISVVESDGHLCFTVFDDGVTDSTGLRSDGSALITDQPKNHPRNGITIVRELLAARGGDLQARRTDTRLGVELCFSLPGRLTDEPALPAFDPSVLARLKPVVKSKSEAMII